jgi:L-seryl-tRNA(Ser) seleniumtransferase
VEQLAKGLVGVPHHLAVAAAREEIAATRMRILEGQPPEDDERALRQAAAARAAALSRPTLRRVINATGVVLHTNLGRAPLAPEAVAAVSEVARGYCNLEYDLAAGTRGIRGAHLEALVCELTSAQSAIAVNNNAAAVLLALAAAAYGREVIVSRGQLVEIGGSFRIPEILGASGARLVEVGTTNRTRLSDYEVGIGPQTAAVLRVHQSNFRTVGFTEEASLEDLRRLAREHDLTLIDDLGSGAVDSVFDEPLVQESVAAGADLVCCSADKLLGGPQAGIIVGNRDAVDRCRKHPLARALRLDKLQLAALAATLRLHRDSGPESIPALAMLRASEASLWMRASTMAEAIGKAAEVERFSSRPGGGSLPLVELWGPVCAVDPGELGADGLALRLQCAEPPIVPRIHQGKVLLDPRTMTDDDAHWAAEAVRRGLG